MDGRSARRDAVGSSRKETNPKGGSVTNKKNKIQQRERERDREGRETEIYVTKDGERGRESKIEGVRNREKQRETERGGGGVSERDRGRQ